VAGIFEIADGDRRIAVAADPRRLQAGSLMCFRKSARVDVRLTLRQPDGSLYRECVIFIGPLRAPA